MKKKCICCNKVLKIVMAGQEYCGPCGLFRKEMRERISSLDAKIKKLEGVEDE